MTFIASILSFLGAAAASTGSNACSIIMLDEPKCPKSLIK